jgi:hypothetical protein
MGGYDNVKVRKARGASGLASEYDSAKPQGLGLGLTSWLDPSKLFGKKGKHARSPASAAR